MPSTERVFTKSFTKNKEQHTSLKLLFKVNSKVSKEIQKI